MADQQQRPDGRWVPAEPMEDSFGMVWEGFWRLRRGRGEWWLPSLVRSLFDARAVRRA